MCVWGAPQVKNLLVPVFWAHLPPALGSTHLSSFYSPPVLSPTLENSLTVPEGESLSQSTKVAPGVSLSPILDSCVWIRCPSPPQD